MKDKVVTADEAVAIIRDRDVLCTSGFVGVGTPDELLMALDTTWRIIDACLERWTPATLETRVERMYGAERQVHSRASIVQRLFSHEAYHCGELSQTLGIAGLPQIDLWRPDS